MLWKGGGVVRVAIIGSRECGHITTDMIARRLPENCSRIISGGARGVDTIAEQLADELELPFQKFLPDYETFGKRAPLVRNLQIIDSADLVLAFWDFESRGTAHTIVQCLRRQIPVRIYQISQLIEL
ncbi:DNA-protecting protein DprA [Ruminococcaceae bacterium OttesenSCG-928-L11]|nr:DNA-protecting protein DprA [Ruminococcaceae bacterium OttesenSCG-928-L11]